MTPRSQPFVLRDGTSRDASALTALFLAARHAAMPWLPALHTEAETRSWIAAVVLRDCRVRVAEADGPVAGFAAFRDDWLEHLYVAPEHQGHGVGSRLLGDVRHVAGTVLQLHVFQRNHRARAFYLSHGFVEADFSDGSGNEEREPDLVMRWTAAP